MPRIRALTWSAIFLCASFVPAYSQTPPSVLPSAPGDASPDVATTSTVTSAQKQAALDTRIAELDKQLKEAEQAQVNDIVAQLGISPEQYEARTLLLRGAVETAARHLETLEQVENIRKSGEETKAQIGSFQGLSEPPPYSFRFVDVLRITARTKEAEVETQQLRLKRLKDSIADAATELQQAQRDLKTKQEAATAAPSAQAEWDLALANARAQLAQINSEYLSDEQVLANETLALRQTELELEKRKQALAEGQLVFSKTHLDEIRARISSLLQETDDEFAKARRQLDVAKANVQPARQAWETASTETQETLKALLDERLAIADNVQRYYEALRDYRANADIAMELWEYRYQIYNNTTQVTARELSARISTIGSNLEKLQEALESRQNAARARSTQLVRDSSEETVDSGLNQLILAELDSLQTLDGAYTRLDVAYGEMLWLVNQTQRELDAKNQTWNKRVLLLKDAAVGIWNYEFTFGEQPISIKSFIIALVVLVGGLAISRRMTAAIRAVVLRRFALNANATAILERTTYYLLIVGIILFALNIVNIPLTVFTFAGGALAIGIGFGAQNVIANFLSGILLFIEQPIKIGDLVEVDGQLGKLVNIGARSSQLRLFAGKDVFIPNSSFLEKNVVNWTHGDALLRYSIRVGVAYGSPVRDVSRMMTRAVEEHGLILKTPAPIVSFEDFGESALIFETYFWVELTETADPRVICSDIRYRIEKLFRESGIIMAYPQRDVNLTAVNPISVRLLPRESESASALKSAKPIEDKPKLP